MLLRTIETANEAVAHAPVEDQSKVAVVVIGRNEGQRLVDCLKSLDSRIGRTVYVDSGSTDGSVRHAEAIGAATVPLDMSIPFTAARARNKGFATIEALWTDIDFVQFVDGDCELDGAWIARAAKFLEANPKVAAVCGRRCERYPERTLYNSLCDRDWKGVPGEVYGCGGDVMMRASAFREAGGYCDSLIAGEEPELCVRLHEHGWIIWHLDAEMTSHDANLQHFRQWWRRSMRGGYAFAQVSFMHRKSTFSIWIPEVTRIVFWAGVLPVTIVLLANPSILLLYPLQIARLAWRNGPSRMVSWRNAFFDMFIKLPEICGVAKFHLNRLLGRPQAIIEYK